MNPFFEQSRMRPALFYKSACPPCQWMSRLVVLFSAGIIRRVPIEGEEAAQLYRIYPQYEGQLVLLHNRRAVCGRMVFAAVPQTLVRTWVLLIRRAVRKLGGQG